MSVAVRVVNIGHWWRMTTCRIGDANRGEAEHNPNSRVVRLSRKNFFRPFLLLPLMSLSNWLNLSLYILYIWFESVHSRELRFVREGGRLRRLLPPWGCRQQSPPNEWGEKEERDSRLRFFLNCSPFRSRIPRKSKMKMVDVSSCRVFHIVWWLWRNILRMTGVRKGDIFPWGEEITLSSEVTKRQRRSDSSHILKKVEECDLQQEGRTSLNRSSVFCVSKENQVWMQNTQIGGLRKSNYTLFLRDRREVWRKRLEDVFHVCIWFPPLPNFSLSLFPLD